MVAQPAPRLSPRGRALEAEAIAIARPLIKQLERWHARVAYIGALAASGRHSTRNPAAYTEELDEIARAVEASMHDLEHSLGPLAQTSRGVDRLGAMRRLLVLISNTRSRIAPAAGQGA